MIERATMKKGELRASDTLSKLNGTILQQQKELKTQRVIQGDKQAHKPH